jgi:hypothetical protein
LCIFNTAQAKGFELEDVVKVLKAVEIRVQKELNKTKPNSKLILLLGFIFQSKAIPIFTLYLSNMNCSFGF